MAANQTLILDMITDGIPPRVHVAQYDTTDRVLTIKLYNVGEVYEIPQDSQVNISGQKPDGHVFDYACEWEGNTITFPLQNQVTVLAGVVNCEITIYGDGILSSKRFIMVVEQASVDLGMASEDTILGLQQIEHDAIRAAASATESAAVALEYKTDAEEAARQAETSAENAAELEEAAGDSAQAAGTSANSAASSASAASDSAYYAGQAAQNAYDSASAAATSATSAARSASDANDSATSAASSASAASDSASAAADSATAAGTSETNAGTSATNAANSASAAADSATAASTSETNAGTSATNAANSASAAADSATAASTSETNAGTSATNAANSASAASDSATAAANSASAASDSASAAADSATAAGTSETNAGTSATNAASSATAAAGSASAAATSKSDAEAWAQGTRNGEPISSSDPIYHKDAKWWAEQASQAAGGGVTSFNGRSGPVRPEAGDYNISQLTATGNAGQYIGFTGNNTLGVIDGPELATTQTAGIVKPDGTSIKVNSNGVISADSGHTIKDSSGTDMPKRSGLKFTGCSVTDDQEHDQTVVDIGAAGLLSVDNSGRLCITYEVA